MTITAARQRNAVSGGVALGLWTLGHREIPNEKQRIDLAFHDVWRDWPAQHRDQFPRVSADLYAELAGSFVMTRADKGQKTSGLFFWEFTGPSFKIRCRTEDWDSDAPGDIARAVESLSGSVSITGWKTLAQAFLNRFYRTPGQIA
ncbi:hypothetical protein ACM0AX_23485 [Mycobacteroides abscessus subsp. abscessus]|uniref:hypothetical protein n=1 Tax=Mycobacteroides abscessus TaxID=36809 RepID=UPI0039F0B17D